MKLVKKIQWKKKMEKKSHEIFVGILMEFNGGTISQLIENLRL